MDNRFIHQYHNILLYIHNNRDLKRLTRSLVNTWISVIVYHGIDYFFYPPRLLASPYICTRAYYYTFRVRQSYPNDDSNNINS